MLYFKNLIVYTMYSTYYIYTMYSTYYIYLERLWHFYVTGLLILFLDFSEPWTVDAKTTKISLHMTLENVLLITLKQITLLLRKS